MENRRSVSRRNLLGGFLGGFSGILVFGYLHPALLPLGVLFGVVAGWWHEEILDTIAKSFWKGVWTGTVCYNCLSRAAVSPVPALRTLYKRLQLNKISRIFIVLVTSIVAVFIWLLYRPIAFINWLRAHPMNCAYLVTAAAFFIFLVITTLWVSQIILWVIPGVTGGTLNYQGKITPFQSTGMAEYLWINIIVLMIVACPSLIVVFRHIEEDMRDMRVFYRIFERYSNRGALAFFFRELFDMLRCQVVVFSFGITGLIYFTGVGTLFIVLVVIPFSAFIYSVKGIYQIASRSGHWLCLGVTMTVTIVSAWLFSSHFDNKHILWSVAFVTGVTSGIITEVVRRSLVWLLTESRYARVEIGVYLKERLAPSGRLVLQGWNQLGCAERVESLSLY